MTKADRQAQQDAIAQLRGWIKPGDTVYTILDHVSKSGMSRAIRVVLLECDDDDSTTTGPRTIKANGARVVDLHPNYAVGKALGLRHWKRNGREQDALVIGGCGMDMGFHLVYELSSVLYGGRRRKLEPAELLTDTTGIEFIGGERYVWEGGYRCLGQGKCPSNYHVNHRDRLRCEGVTVGEDRRFCYRPDAYNSRYTVPDDWPRAEPITLESEGGPVTLPGRLLACTRNREEHGAYEVCSTCHGAGDVPNPDGPERFDLIHTDGYALRHRWL